MNEDTTTFDQPDADGDLAALLRAVGPRPLPPADVADQVRAVVAAEWHATVAARQPRRRPTVWLAAASVAALALAIGMALPRLGPQQDGYATVARVTGDVELRHGRDQAWQPLDASMRIGAGDELQTSSQGRVALRRPDGLEVRLDVATQLAFNDAESARLEHGSAYVDAGSTGKSAAFTLETAFGAVRHLGTQYLVQLGSGDLSVLVREGSVSVERGHAPVVAQAGEKLLVARDGTVSRSRVDAHGDAWRWAESVTPGYAIDGRSLDEFLTWAARETGRTLVYTSADAAREAERTELKGSVQGLSAEAAVAAVMSTTPSLQHAMAGGQLRIELGGGDGSR